jgi:hypothetical protein
MRTEANPAQVFRSKLDTHFKKNSKIPLQELIEPSKRGNVIPEGTLVLMPFVNGEIRLKILDAATPDKGFSIPLQISNRGLQANITANYLSWHLTQDFVKNYLILFIRGSVFPRIPRYVLLDLLVPIPLYKKKYSNPVETSVLKTENPFRDLINSLYRDYLMNCKQERYRTAIILAGAIAEAILYQLLLDNEVDNALIEGDTLGQLIKYVKLLRLEQQLNFPLGDFSTLQKYRNSAIHTGRAIRERYSFSKNDLRCFDQIIKHFGI